MSDAKPKQSDFRYDTGTAKVPWDAVGERFSPSDALQMLQFLFPSRPGSEPKYDRVMTRLAVDLEELDQHATRAGKLTLGPRVAAAEKAAREYLGARHACLLSNWTGGMEIAYKLAGLRPGDEVILPAITFVACMAYPLSIGAKIVFADVDPRTVNLDAADVARKVTPRTRVVMPVHVGGAVCDMTPLMALAKRHDFAVIEDAAHALGAKYQGRYAGTIGHFGGYSLHEVKNINALGEGGLLVTNEAAGEQFARARFLGLDFSTQIRNWLYDITPLRDRFGRPQVPGNHSVTELQAVAFCCQLARLDRLIAGRRQVADYLTARLREEPGIETPAADTAETYSSHHLYLLRLNPAVVRGDVQALKAKLKARGVTEIQHFGPLYRFRLMKDLGYDEAAIAASCPQTEAVFDHGYTHLPLAGLSREQVDYMADAVIASVRELKAGK